MRKVRLHARLQEKVEAEKAQADAPDYTQCKNKLKYIGMPSVGCASIASLHLDATRLSCI